MAARCTARAGKEGQVQTKLFQRASFSTLSGSIPDRPGASWEAASPVVTLAGRVQDALPEPTAQLQGSHAPDAEGVKVSLPAAHLADSPHRPVHRLDLVLRCYPLGPLVAEQRRVGALLPSPCDVLQEPGVEHDESKGDEGFLEASPEPLSADAHIAQLAQMRVLFEEPEDVSVEDLCKEGLCNRHPVVLLRCRNQADELPQVGDLRLHPFLLGCHEVADALLELCLHRRLIAADGQQEVVEAHVAAEGLLRCPGLTFHQKHHLGSCLKKGSPF